MTRLLLWRHGETEWNAAGRFQGQCDVGLSAVGRAQAAQVAVRLASEKPDAVFTSDLRRAMETAQALAEVVGLSVRPDPRLRERYFGEWQGLTGDEVRSRWPDEYARWRAGDPSPGCGIEHYDELRQRVGTALREIADEYPTGTVVVTTHGGAALEGIAALLGWPPQVRWTVAPLANCRWTELVYQPVRGWRLAAHNAG